MSTITKIILGIFGAIIGAIVIGLTLSFLIGPIDTGNANVGEAIAEIGDTLFNQSQEDEIPETEDGAEAESDYENSGTSENGIRNIVRNRISSMTAPNSENSEAYEDDYAQDEDEPEAPAPPHPIVGSWETTTLVEIDTESTGDIAETKRFSEDGTGIMFHSESPQMRDFSWRIENNNLTITPVDTSVRITTHNFDISENTLTIFFNRNRTSYIEATRIN